MKKRYRLFCFFCFVIFNELYAGSMDSSALVNIVSVVPNIQIDLKYATADNFTGQVIYDSQECFVHVDTAARLKQVQAELNAMGLSLKMWDGFRPFKAQEKFWEVCPDPRYVSDPKKGGRHTRGTAVDVTIVTLDGQELRMPTQFDDFSEKAHRDYMGASEEQMQNRELLREVMERSGFVGLSTEWWHFDLAQWRDYPVIEGDGGL